MDMDAITQQLNAAPSREAGHAVIADLLVTELKAYTRHRGLGLYPTKRQLRDQIVNTFVGRRVDSLALERHPR